MTSTSSPQATTNDNVLGTPLGTIEENMHDIGQTEDAEVISNADLYIVTPPAYSQSIVEGERTIDAEATQEDKSRAQDHIMEESLLGRASPRAMSDSILDNRPATPLHVLQERAREQTGHLVPTGPTPLLTHHLIDPAVTVALVGARECSILHDRPAIWLVRKNKMALSPLAASVLVKEGILNPKHLELISEHPATRRDPTDPLSSVFLGVYDTLGEIMLGAVAGPVELGRQATPVLTRFESRQRNNSDGNTQPFSSQDMKRAPQVAGKVAIETGKGLGRIVTTSLKAPMVLMHGVTRGFHNLPKAYGEEVREYENITGIKSGFSVSAKSFGYGLSDGLLDLFAKPVQGAEKNGVIGFASGCAKGLGNAMFKPAAGACGLIGYPFVGLYKEIRNIKFSDQGECPADLVWQLGETEYKQATDTDKLYIVRVWCQTMMRVRLA